MNLFFFVTLFFYNFSNKFYRTTNKFNNKKLFKFELTLIAKKGNPSALKKIIL